MISSPGDDCYDFYYTDILARVQAVANTIGLRKSGLLRLLLISQE